MTHPAPRLLLLLSLLAGAPSLAQYKPPPLTEPERILRSADESRGDAASADAHGDAKTALERYHRAMALYLQAMASEPTLVAAAGGYGLAGNAVREYAEVVARLGPIQASHPDEPELALPLGLALYKLKRYAEARPLLELVARGDRPEDFIVHYYLGSRALAEQRATDAVGSLRKYLSLRPAELAKNDPEVEELLGRAYLLLRQPTEARAMFQQAQHGRPESLSCQLGLEAVLELEGKTSDAIALLQGLAHRNPRAPEPRERLGLLLLAAGQTAPAETVANDLLQLQASPGAYLLLGKVHLAQKQGARAEQDLRKALQAAPTSIAAQVALAQALELQGKSDPATALLETAIRDGADSVEIWAALGSVSRRAGHFQRALEAHRRVVSMAPTQAQGYLLLGADHFATGQWDEAIEDYQHGLEREPRNVRARHFLAICLVHRARARLASGLADTAVRDLRRSLDLERTVNTARALGATLLIQKAYAEARAALEDAVKLPGAGWRELELLGYARLGAGDAASALSAFEQAGKAVKEAEPAAEIYAGWALTKLELGEYDTAVERLQTPGASAIAAQVTQANLPLALGRRALAKLGAGDAAGAARDVDAGEKLPPGRGEAQWVLRLARALVEVEQGAFPEASAGLRVALTPGGAGADPATLPLLEAFVLYRQDRLPQARKRLAQAHHGAAGRKTAWAGELERAIDRREAELDYAHGQLPKAEKALQAAASQDPLNPIVVHNSACILYRRGKFDAALDGWRSVLPAVPEAALNLGMDAQERLKDPRQAVDFYGKYVSAGGSRAGMAREWRDRLIAIYGLKASEAAP